MQSLIWIGSIFVLAGIAGLAACIVMVMRARRAGLEDAEMKAKLQKVVAWNLGALGVSALGLMMVIMGIMLG